MKKRVKEFLFKLTSKDLEKLIHPNKVRILNCINKNGKMNFLQIQKAFKYDMDYKEVRRLSNSLLKAGLLKRQKKTRKQGEPVFMRLKKGILAKGDQK